MLSTSTIPVHYLIASEPRVLCWRPDQPEPAVIQYYGHPGLRKITCLRCIGIIRTAWESYPPQAEERQNFDQWLKTSLESATVNATPSDNPDGGITHIT